LKPIPARFAPLVDSMMNTARGILERGEKLAPLAFVGRSATGELFPVSIDTDGPENKELSANQIRLTADMVKADFIFSVMEAWALPKRLLTRHQEILDRYGSIGASPHKEDVVTFSLESRDGVWVGSAAIKPKPPSKKKRTFGQVDFIFADGVEGRFVGLLPAPTAAEQTVH
jgi:hypothetical protein